MTNSLRKAVKTHTTVFGIDEIV